MTAKFEKGKLTMLETDRVGEASNPTPETPVIHQQESKDQNVAHSRGKGHASAVKDSLFDRESVSLL